MVFGCVTNILSCLCNAVCYLYHDQFTAVLVIIALAVGISWYQRAQTKSRRRKWNSVGKDVVVLHGFPRSKVSPNLSPFVLKLETYLRMTNIKYEFDGIETYGAKGKTPWINLNGQSYADSELIIEILNRKFSKDLDSHLSQEEKAVSRFMKIMINEHMFWAVEHWLTVDPNRAIFTLMDIPSYYTIFYPIFKYQLQQKVKSQGLGVHSDKEIEEIMRKNFEAISVYLGNKSYLMGSQPSEVDNSAFGFLGHFLLGQPGSPFQAMIEKTYPNLHQYFLRMKDIYYKDWDTLLCK